MGLPTSEKEEKEKEKNRKRKREKKENRRRNRKSKQKSKENTIKTQIKRPINRKIAKHIERTDTENIAGLSKLLYKEKEKNDIEEIISERKGTKRFRCENCDEIINGKAQLTRHTK